MALSDWREPARQKSTKPCFSQKVSAKCSHSWLQTMKRSLSKSVTGIAALYSWKNLALIAGSDALRPSKKTRSTLSKTSLRSASPWRNKHGHRASWAGLLLRHMAVYYNCYAIHKGYHLTCGRLLEVHSW